MAYTGCMDARPISVFKECSRVVETAFGWGLLAAGFYVVLFIDVTGDGSLCSSLRGLYDYVQVQDELPNAVRTIKVTARHRREIPADERMLIVTDAVDNEDMVAASIPAPDASYAWPAPDFLDSAADPETGKQWKKGIQGQLRRFTVYGRGEETASALAQVQALSAPRAAAPRPPVAALGLRRESR